MPETPSQGTPIRRPVRGAFLVAALLLPAFLLTSFLLTAAPARADDEDEATIRELRREVVELRRELAVREVEIARLAEALDELRATCEAGTTQIRTPGSAASEDNPAPGDSVPGDLVGRPDQPPEGGAPIEVVGRVEERELEEPDPIEAAPEPDPAEPPTLEGDALYDRGYSLFHEGEYARSEAAFRRFLELHAESDLADNAQFWIGESRWARGDFAAALEGYTRTVERYPDGNKVPDALLKAGRCLENLGQVGRAIQTYEAVIVRFAGSAAALTAEERLAELRAAGGGP